MNNKKGVKLLAAIAVLAMMLAAVAVVLPAAESSAEGDGSAAASEIVFKNAIGDIKYGTNITNTAIGNKISVAYDATTNTYTVTGTVANIGTIDELKASNATELQKEFWGTWAVDTMPTHAIVFQFSEIAGKSLIFYDAAVEQVKTEEVPTVMLQYVSESIMDRTYYIVDTTTASTITDKAKFDAMVQAGGIEVINLHIDVTLSESTNAGKGYVAVENGNALISSAIQKGTDGASGKWALDNGTLTLTNYNGKEYFDGTFNKIVLVGDNTIALAGVSNAIKAGNLTIMSVDGVGSLAIDMTVSAAAKAIEAEELSINGVTVTIDVIEDVDADASAIKTVGIDATSYDIYDATVKITVGEDNYTEAIGLNATNGDVSIRSANVTINAGNRAINANGSVSIMASEVSVSGSEIGIRTYSNVEADITITNSSKVTANALGLADGFYTPYGISANDALIVQSDSVVKTDGLMIYGLGTTDSANNATIINDGDMIIWQDALFENKATLENNGTIGVYGTLKNSAGQITNNGTIQNYNVVRNGGIETTAQMTFNDVTGKDVTVKIAKISPQADGTFIVIVETTAVAHVQTTTLGADSDAPRKFQGTMVATYVSSEVGYTYVIEASNNDGVFNLSYDGTEANLYISQDDVVGNEIKDDTTLGNVKAIGTTLFTSCASEITVTGGKLVNSSKIVINDTTALVAGGELVNSGDMTFNANVTVSSGKLNGNDIIVANGVVVSLTGTVDMTFTNSGTYTYRPTGATADATVEYSDSIKVTGTPKGTILTAPVNADKGVMTIAVPNTDSSKSAQIVILKGAAKVASNIGLNMTLLATSGTTLTIVGTVNAIDGVIGIEDGATINMKISGNKDTVGYGTLNYVISFVNAGYTYYGSLQYALANAAEGATLNLNSQANINVDTVVKKGITLVFAENATLNIANDVTEKITVSMEEGAKFVLAKGASVVITGGKATVSGDIVYDVNEIVLDKVVFTNDTTISAAVATKTEASAAKIANGSDGIATANDGKITVAAGNATGKLTLQAVTESSKLKNTANIAVAAGAISKIVLVDNIYTETVIDGTMTSAGDIAFLGAVSGDGAILLADGKKVTFTKDVVDINVTNGTDSVVLDKISGKYYNDNGDYVGDDSTTLIIQSFAKTSTKDAYLDIYGDVISGNIAVDGNAAIGTSGKIFDLKADVVMTVPAGSTITVVKIDNDNTRMNTVTGLLKVAGTINMYDADDSDTKSYGKLNYQITYADGEYTVYTMLNTGVNNAKAGDSFTVTGVVTITGTEDPMIIPAGVTITIDEEATFTIDNNYVVIGTPITTLGAGSSSIVGKVILANKAFLIAYNDDSVDLSKTKVVDSTDKTAKNSQYNMLNEIYATVYVAEATGSQEELVEEVLVPAIDGYRFLGWKPLVETKVIGETDFDANMKANMVQVTFQKVDGISYYVDNEKMNIVGAPVYVAYGATITAVADSGYTGTPLVNGKAYILVDTSLKTVVGSGVSPAEPVTPVTPVEPEKKDDGMGLTDILLIVLVILAAILVIVVAIRMMRS